MYIVIYAILSHCFLQFALIFEPGSLWKDVNRCTGEDIVDLCDILLICLFILLIYFIYF